MPVLAQYGRDQERVPRMAGAPTDEEENFGLIRGCACHPWDIHEPDCREDSTKIQAKIDPTALDSDVTRWSEGFSLCPAADKG